MSENHLEPREEDPVQVKRWRFSVRKKFNALTAITGSILEDSTVLSDPVTKAQGEVLQAKINELVAKQNQIITAFQG